MKTLILLSTLILISKACSSQKISEFDSLRKYSYLIIGASFEPQKINEQPSIYNLKPVSYATGFFYKKNDSLLLISAAHVIYCIDVYQVKRVQTKIDYLIVRYYDTLNNIKYYAMPINEIKLSVEPFYFLDKPDVSWIFSKDAFKGGYINTINDFISKKQHKVKKRYRTKFISFGFPSYEHVKFQSSAQYDDFVNPSFYEGKLADSSHYAPLYKSQNIDSMYYTITPKTWGGTSGSPVFRYVYKNKRKQWVELIGVQSGKNEKYNCSYIVKKNELLKILGLKIN